MMYNFRVGAVDEVRFTSTSPELDGMYKLSPCVWAEEGRFDLLLRMVNYSEIPSEKIARIHYGTSKDGLRFLLQESPAIEPEPDPNAYDNGGCEDPTLALVDGTYYVYYSGWNENKKRGELLLATGNDVLHLEKRGVALASSAQTANPKEATIVRVADGTWRLFFEYANDNKSKIGLARSVSVGGPWEVLEPPFDARAQSWDSWHLSTGPIFASDPRYPVMFYNGATKDAHWRIGWVAFNSDYTKVLDRSEKALLTPTIHRKKDDTDIAFAASALQINGDIHLYYSIADQYVARAVIEVLGVPD
jgi:beta-1,2-mannobiose phosphorylase / 1,2-beta-oligomannan phosphorylase